MTAPTAALDARADAAWQRLDMTGRAYATAYIERLAIMQDHRPLAIVRDRADRHRRRETLLLPETAMAEAIDSMGDDDDE